MTLAGAPRAAWRFGVLLLPMLGLPCFALALGLLSGLRIEAGAGEAALTEAAHRLLLGVVGSGFIAAELLAFGLGSGVVLRAATLAQVASAAAAGDFRLVPPPGDADEIGGLSNALGRAMRQLAQRRSELDWMAHATARQGLVSGAAERIAGLVAPLGQTARFATVDADANPNWLHAPRQRLLAALAGGVVVLAAAPVAPAWFAAIAAVALVGGRCSERLRALGVPCVLLAVTAALTHALLGGDAVSGALLCALAAGVAVHCGGGWRGPAGGAADAAWLRGGLAGAVSGAGAAAALLGVLGPEPAGAVVLPLLLATLGLVAASLAPPPATATPANWLSAQAALALLRHAAVRRQLLGGALPGGIALGAAIAVAAHDASHVVLAAAVAGALATLPGLGFEALARPRRWLAIGCLAAASAALGLGDMPVAVVLGGAGAVFAWPVATLAAPGCATPRQAAILGALLRGCGVAIALFSAPLLPPGGVAALAALALLAGVRPARRA